MSVINPNQYASPFAAPNVLGDLESHAGGPLGGTNAVSPQLSDAIFKGNPVALPQPPVYAPVAGGFGDVPAGGAGMGSAISSIIAELGTIVNALLQQLQSAFSGSGSGVSQPISNPIATPGTGEEAFANATASSVGDPHLSFAGSTAAGTAVSGKWDSMTSHGDLLGSDSFAGGYRISTQASQPNAKGIAYNDSATVTSKHGMASVTLQKDGSYSVTDHGHEISLVAGQETALGHGESVELNADGSLTVADHNEQGGSITTTLKSNGSGVDVSTSAHSVDLGGYLVDKSENDYDPVASAPPIQSIVAGGDAGLSYTTEPWMTQPSQQPWQPSELGLEQFDPDLDNANLSNVEFA